MKPDTQVFAGLLGMILGLQFNWLTALVIVFIVVVVAVVGLVLCNRYATPPEIRVEERDVHQPNLLP